MVLKRVPLGTAANLILPFVTTAVYTTSTEYKLAGWPPLFLIAAPLPLPCTPPNTLSQV